MTLKKVDLVIHPVRLRILQTLTQSAHTQGATTQQIAGALPDTPKSSIYRHLKLLLDGEMIEVAETRLVHGIQEKIYRLLQLPRLGAEDMAGLTAEDHLRYFTTYTATLLQGFADYLQASPGLDLAADRTGYTEVTFYANQAELDQFGAALNQALLPFLQNPPGDDRHKHKIAVITHPIGSEQ